jgi:hypothetical protein
MPYGYFFDTSTNIAVITDSNTFSSVFNTDYPNNQITTGFQLNGVDIGSMITPNDSGLFLTANNYHYLINSNNINTTFSFTKPKPRVAVTNCASISNMTLADGDYTFYEFYTGSTGTFQLNTSIPNIVLDLNVLLIGGGGAGGHYNGEVGEGAGGGGAGSYVTTIIMANSSFGLTINVGAGGAGTTVAEASGDPGNSSTITTSNNYSLVAAGGGSGGSAYGGNGTQRNGILPNKTLYGSTGGADGAFGTNYAYDAVTGYSSNDSNNTIFTNIESYTNKGGNGIRWAGGAGGGGAGGPGADNTPTTIDDFGVTYDVYYLGGNGGNGRTWINGLTYAGGGGGGVAVNTTGQDSAGGTGGGGSSAVQNYGNYGDGAANTGSGGGAAWAGNSSGNGGSGICIIAVKTSDIN